MKFQRMASRNSLGTILAHDISINGLNLKEGQIIDDDVIRSLLEVGQEEIYTAQLDRTDVSENIAVKLMADSFVVDGFYKTEAKTGRINLIADHDGIAVINETCVNQLNAIDPGISVATVPQHTFVEQGHRIATLKVIPFGVSETLLSMWRKVACSHSELLSTRPITPIQAALIITGGSERSRYVSSVKRDAADSVEQFKGRIIYSGECLHNEASIVETIQRALKKSDVNSIIICGAEPTIDKADVLGQAVSNCGGEIVFLGMPIDPGNLTMLANIKNIPVISTNIINGRLPRKSLSLLFSRITANLPVTHKDIVVESGVGGLEPHKETLRKSAFDPAILSL